MSARDRRQQTPSADCFADAIADPVHWGGIDNELTKHGIVIGDGPAFEHVKSFAAQQTGETARGVGAKVIRRLKRPVLGAMDDLARCRSQRSMIGHIDVHQISHFLCRANEGLRVAKVLDDLGAEHDIESAGYRIRKLADYDVQSSAFPSSCGHFRHRLNANVSTADAIPCPPPRRIAAADFEYRLEGATKAILIHFPSLGDERTRHNFLRFDMRRCGAPKRFVALDDAVGARSENEAAGPAFSYRQGAKGNLTAVARTGRAIPHARSIPPLRLAEKRDAA